MQESVLINSRDSQVAKAAYNALPAGHPAKVAHVGLSSPTEIAIARSKRRAKARAQRKLEKARSANKKALVEHHMTRLQSLVGIQGQTLQVSRGGYQQLCSHQH